MKLEQLTEGRFEADEDQLARIKKTHDEFYKKYKGNLSRVESMVVNTNQNLTNYALIKAFKKLGILHFDKSNKGYTSTTFKRAQKYADKKGLKMP